jgi:putative PIN family toxin of toxin-antitoxin system
MMKVVIDTGVFVSAALSIAARNSSWSQELVEESLAGERFELVTSEMMLLELADVLSRRRIGLVAEFAAAFIERIASVATIVAIRGLAMGCRDPRDDKVLETALNANVDFLVARDRDLHTPRSRYSIEKVGPGIRDRPIRVVSVSAFIEALRGPDFSAFVITSLAEIG